MADRVEFTSFILIRHQLSLICFLYRSSNRGNFLEILRWASTTDPSVSSIFDDAASHATYLSHDIQNELVDIMSNQIREEISSTVIQDDYIVNRHSI